jgi:hypothetical protein
MDTPLIGSIDLLLVPVYCLLLYFIFLSIKKKHPGDFLMQKYFIKGFVVKILGGIFLGLLVYYFYGVGDTLTYFNESLRLRQLLQEGKITFTQIFTNEYMYFREKFDLQGSVTDSGFVVTKISFLLTYLSFSRFLLATCLMASLVYFGIFRLFRSFVAIAPSSHRIIAIIVLFFPSTVIYGSGIFKDPICISALGWSFYASHQMLIEKKVSLLNALIFLAAFTIIFEVKAYIIAAYLIPFCLFLVMTMVKRIKPAMFRWVTFFVLVAMISGLYFSFREAIDDSFGTYAVSKLSDNVQGLQAAYSTLSEEDAGSNFDIGEMEPTLSGLLSKMPAGILATLFRPYLWEVKKLLVLLTALESFGILLFTLFTFFKAGPIKALGYIVSDATIFLCIGFALIFAGFVGISTPNFGTLVRYRIPAIPFYLFGLLLILKKASAGKAVATAVPAAPQYSPYK